MIAPPNEIIDILIIKNGNLALAENATEQQKKIFANFENELKKEEENYNQCLIFKIWYKLARLAMNQVNYI